jgi:phytoene synthase
MTDRSSASDNDRMFCWEQVSRTNRLFRISRVFASRHCTERLLPLYALFSVVEQMSSTLSDADVATSKMNWWRSECLHQNMAESQHPLVRELARTGAANRMPGEGIAKLFYGAERRLSATAPTDMAALRNQCIETYQPQLELELSVSGPQIAVGDFSPGLLARNGLLQLVRESARRKGQGSYWWIPLNSLARHGVSREEIAQCPESPNVTKLLSEVLTEGVSWGKHTGDAPATPAIDFSPARHVFSISGLYARKLQSLVAAAPDQFTAILARLQPADLFGAWACARRLR